ncbi:MAG TPA: prolyl oligopeptidase family serine peptidase [Telluria sp.]|nr:prolyl oligopeptidase family serine peptidase [Telluria sp.]
MNAKAVAALLGLAVLAACGGGGGPAGGGTALDAGSGGQAADDARGTLTAAPAAVAVHVGAVPVNQIAPDVFAAWLDAQQAGTTLITGTPVCAVSVSRIVYRTVGARGEATTAAAAVMAPSGAGCAGPRPVLLYAHGTSVARDFDMSALDANREAQLVAAMFAAQGYIVVAPNYTGYAGSTLGYHPYLNADAQADDMVDAWRAARRGLAQIGVAASDRLFIAGYSQGGHVALATQRALQQRYAGEAAVTAVAGMSGPYALLQMGDAIFAGAPTVGVTAFLPLLTGGAQRGGAGLYADAGEMYETRYAAGIDLLLPGPRSVSELVAAGLLPASALFGADSLPQLAGHAEGFGADHLVTEAYRSAYLADLQAAPCTAGVASGCAPANALRRFMRANDLRTFVPAAPTLLCGGDADPTVPYANTQAFVRHVAGAGAAAELVEVNIDTTPNFGDTYRNAKLGFAAAKLALRRSGGDAAVVTNYHAGLVAPFCLGVARDYFRAKL